jgi:hypothetical protein
MPPGGVPWSEEFPPLSNCRGVGADDCGVGGGVRERSQGAASGSDAGGIRERDVPFIFPRRPLVASGSSEQRGVYLPGGPLASSPSILGAVLLFPALTTLLRNSPRSPILPRVLRTFFFFLPRYSPASTRYPARSGAKLSTLLSVDSVMVSSGSRNPSVTNHEGFFAPSANRGRASVSRKGDAGLNSPRVRRGALLALVGALRSGHSLPGKQVASSHFTPPIRKRSSRGRADAMRVAQWALPL